MNTTKNLVARAAKALRYSPDTRYLKRELANGNPYALRVLAIRGLFYENGAIVRKDV